MSEKKKEARGEGQSHWLVGIGLAAQLWTVCGLTTLGLIGLGGYFIVQMGQVFEAVNYGSVNSVPSIKVLSKALENGKAYYALTIRHVLNTEPQAMSELEQLLKVAQRNAQTELTNYQALISNNADRQKLAEDQAALDALVDVVEDVLPLSRVNQNEQARSILNARGSPAIVELQERLDKHVDFNENLARESSHQGESVYRTAQTVGIAAIGVVSLFLCGLIVAIGRAIPERDAYVNVRLAAIALLIVASFTGVGGYLLQQMDKVYREANYANEKTAPSLAALSDILDQNDDYYEYVLTHVLNTDAEIMRQLEEKIGRTIKKMRQGLSDYDARLAEDYQDRNLLIADQTALAQMMGMVDKVLPLSRENRLEAARDVLTRTVVPTLEEFKAALTKHLKYNISLAERGSQEGEAHYRATCENSVLIIGILSVVLVGIKALITQSLLRRGEGLAAVYRFVRDIRNLTFIVVGATVATAGVSAYIAWTANQEIIQSAKQRELLATATLIQTRLQASAARAASLAALIASLSSVREAFRAGDQAALAKLGPTFLLQRSRFNVITAQFFLPPATLFMRVTDPNVRQGEDQSSFREMMVKTNHDQEPQMGVEVGRTGLYIRGSDVVRDAQGLIGCFEVGLAFSPLLEGVKDSSGFDAGVFVDEELLSRVATALMRPSSDQIIGGYRSVSVTDWNIMKRLVTPDLIVRVKDIATSITTVEGIDYGMVMVPLLDYNGSQIGVIAAAREFEGYQKQIYAAVVRSIALALFQVLVLAGIMIVLIRVKQACPVGAENAP
jgi:methyl-accepting chemotaxis protein